MQRAILSGVKHISDETTAISSGIRQVLDSTDSLAHRARKEDIRITQEATESENF